MDLMGKNALVTGSGIRLGRAIALALGQAPEQVVALAGRVGQLALELPGALLQLVGELLGGAHAVGEGLLGHLRAAGAALGQDRGIDDGAVVLLGVV